MERAVEGRDLLWQKKMRRGRGGGGWRMSLCLREMPSLEGRLYLVQNQDRFLGALGSFRPRSSNSSRRCLKRGRWCVRSLRVWRVLRRKLERWRELRGS